MEAPSLAAGPEFSREELQLAARNHALPLEALRLPLTPAGLHYVLVHYDIPLVREDRWRLSVDGAVERPASLSLEALQSRPSSQVTVTMECAGNGRAGLSPRPVSQPWLVEAVGTARWTGVPLRALLEEAGVSAGAREVVFTGLDRGVEGGVEQSYQRSLPLEEALRAEVLLAFGMGDAPLPPQHGFPLRLVVPGWYGMTNVKWLTRITVVEAPFEGYQMTRSYRLRQSPEESGEPVTRMLPRSLMVPPGLPDFMTRERILEPGRVRLEGRAWSGQAPVEAVEVTLDGGHFWRPAILGDPPEGPFAWRGWSYDWSAAPGAHRLGSRARDAAGNVQPLEPPWNLGGYQNNAVQWLQVTVR